MQTLREFRSLAASESIEHRAAILSKADQSLNERAYFKDGFDE